MGLLKRFILATASTFHLRAPGGGYEWWTLMSWTCRPVNPVESIYLCQSRLTYVKTQTAVSVRTSDHAYVVDMRQSKNFTFLKFRGTSPVLMLCRYELSSLTGSYESQLDKIELCIRDEAIWKAKPRASLNLVIKCGNTFQIRICVVAWVASQGSIKQSLS